MIEFDIEFRSFISDWQHCDHISSYLARTISHNRPDSVLYSNLYSSAFNELLEVAFRTRHPAGVLACKLSRDGDRDRIELTFPCTEEERQFYQYAVSQIQDTSARERYLVSLSGDVAPSRDIVLLELALDYNAGLSLETTDADSITLTVDLPLGGLEN
ncbi:ubiquinone biosynthesis methyltransferase UbiE [Mesorhizobium sp. BAC0120]|uniref:ubiquinone biosynthesis methyltransferase UbiE n=1 Tax=Mesorhizobium sp. BAC0120 TaxID=3090670 RepID=UPI00298CEA79|nr:ubiquinone biosynthesis methyltransferase UbiE [Mesorhizobium sp. BAC0120]MDW6023484.1 ubiquinone biosynthesis methyltransferase UbiE [Mesorhizobium sp. BAC0120]